MNTPTTPEIETVVVPESLKRKPNRATRILAIGSGVVVLALIVGAAIVVPQWVHTARVEQYQALIAETEALALSEATAELQIEATLALTELQTEAAREFAVSLIELGETKEPIFSAGTAEALAQAGEDLRTALGEPTPPGEGEEVADLPLRAAHQERIAADAEAAQVAEGDEAPAIREEPITTNELLLTTEEVIALLGLEPATVRLVIVPEADVTRDTVTAAESARDEQQEVTSTAETRLTSATALSEELHRLLDGTIPALLAAAAEAPGQAELVVAKFGKATKDQLAAVSEAAVTLHDMTDAPGLLDGARTYVDAVKIAEKKHAKVLADEAAKKAAASGASSYRDPTTGSWVSVPPSHTGGGNTGGGGSSGGGGGGVSIPAGGPSVYDSGMPCNVKSQSKSGSGWPSSVGIPLGDYRFKSYESWYHADGWTVKWYCDLVAGGW